MRLAFPGAPQPEPGRLPAGLLALVVHLAFFAFLTFSVSWKAQPPQGMTVELWGALPGAPAAAPAPPEPQPAPPPAPRVQEAARPEPAPAPRPDIALKEKAKKEAEQRRLEQERAERARRDEQARQAAELARLQGEQEALNRRLQQQQAAGQARLIDDYRGRIMARVKRFVVMPPDLPGNPQAEFDVVLLPSGDVLSVKLTRPSGHAAYDQAVERAILKAQPLPLPPDPALFPHFRNLALKFRPLE